MSRRTPIGAGCCASRRTPTCASTPMTTRSSRSWSAGVEARISDREVLAVALDTGELACRHARSFAKHRTITALEHARTLKAQPHDRRGRTEPQVQLRSLAAYDALIA